MLVLSLATLGMASNSRSSARMVASWAVRYSRMAVWIRAADCALPWMGSARAARIVSAAFDCKQESFLMLEPIRVAGDLRQPGQTVRNG